MYIKSARITNIRSIEDFEINFEEPAGWHVLIGDNGSGKSTIIRSLALALVGPEEAMELRRFWQDWLNNNETNAMIWLLFERAKQNEYLKAKKEDVGTQRHSVANITIRLQRKIDTENDSKVFFKVDSSNFTQAKADKEFFSVAYGPYRRFSGGNQEWNNVFVNQPKLAAHLSVFSEDVALTEPIDWLIKLNHQELEQRLNAVSFFSNKWTEQENYPVEDSLSILGSIKKLVNAPDFLPNHTKFESVSSKGVFFQDGNGNQITVNQLSDGYRSILSLTFELIRQLIDFYGEDAIFKNIREDKMYIDLPGVVLIDEIDAHLHPTWQTKIGQWFTKYFPNLQFIVTTHSPLVCRAAIKGTIWKLAEPGSDDKSKEITGIDRDRLIYGNLIEAYGTGAFEEDVSPSENSEKMRKELADLSKKSFKGIITDDEKREMNRIKEILPAS